MQSREELTNEIRDLLNATTLPSVMISRALLSDTYQTLMALRKSFLKMEDLLDIARDDRYKDRRRHLELMGKMSSVLRQYACDCSSCCVDMPEDASYCGWAAREAMEGKV